MNIIKNILVPIDFSSSAKNALGYIQGLTKRDRSVKFTLLNCVTTSPEMKQSTDRLVEIKKVYFDNEKIPCQTISMVGRLHDCVSEILKSSNVDMVVIGTSGQADQNQSSNTASLVAYVDCPVWVIPENAKNFQLNNIALALDEKELDNASDLGLFHDIAKWYNAKVHLLKVDPEDSNREKLNLRKEYTLAYYLDNLDYHYSFPKNSNIEEGINDYIYKNNIDALAIIPRLHAKNSTPSKGALTKALVSHSKFPILVID